MSGVLRTDEELAEETGSILAAWFMANPNGPTAWALGYVEEGERNILFYRWMHFTGGRTYRLGALGDSGFKCGEEGFWECEILGVLLRLHNRFTATGDDAPPFLTAPSAVLTNGNPLVAQTIRTFASLAARTNKGQDWGREAYYTTKYRSDFFGRAEEEFREACEQLRSDPLADREGLRNVWAEHEQKPGFRDWLPGRYRTSPYTEDLFAAWWNIVTDRDVLRRGALLRFAQMWAGASASARDRGLMDRLTEAGSYVPLGAVLRFFTQFNMPLFPAFIDEDHIRRGMRLDRG